MDKKIIYFVANNLDTISGIYFNHSTMVESFNSHIHDFYELEIVIKGGCGEFLDGEFFEIAEGDVYILTPDDIHSFVLPEEGGHVEILNVSFHKKYVADHIRASLDRIHTPIVPKVDQDQYHFIYTLAKQAKQEIMSENVFRKAAAEHMLNTILCMLLGMENYFTKMMTNDQLRISCILEYISKNFTQDISLVDIAEKFSLSPFYLSTLLTENLGKGFREILNMYRLRQVANELLATDKAITDICYDAGYQNYSPFTRMFKQHFGMTPTQYRKKMRGKSQVTG